MDQANSTRVVVVRERINEWGGFERLDAAVLRAALRLRGLNVDVVASALAELPFLASRSLDETPRVVILPDGEIVTLIDDICSSLEQSATAIAILADAVWEADVLQEVWGRLTNLSRSRESPTLCWHFDANHCAIAECLRNEVADVIRRHFSRLVLVEPNKDREVRSIRDMLGKVGIEVVTIPPPSTADEAAALAWGTDAMFSPCRSANLAALAFGRLALASPEDFCEPECSPTSFRPLVWDALAIARSRHALRREAQLLIAELCQSLADQDSGLEPTKDGMLHVLARLISRQAGRLAELETAHRAATRLLREIDDTYSRRLDRFRIRLVETAYRATHAVPFLPEALRWQAQTAQQCLGGFRHLGNIATHWTRWTIQLLRATARSLTSALGDSRQKATRTGQVLAKQGIGDGQPSSKDPRGFYSSAAKAASRFARLCWLRIRDEITHRPTANLSAWFRHYRPNARLLNRLRRTTWPGHAPRFSVLCVVADDVPRWLDDTARSAIGQTYPHWDFTCVVVGQRCRETRDVLANLSADPRVRILESEELTDPIQLGVRTSQGDFVLCLRLGETLEPQALHRFATAILAEDADIVYGDEVRTAACDLDHVLEVTFRQAFSYDAFLHHDNFGSTVAIRRSLVEDVTSGTTHFDRNATFRVVEQARRVTHVADILVRKRWCATDCTFDQATEVSALRHHLQRMRVPATVMTRDDGTPWITFPPPAGSRVAIIVPTKNRGDLLRLCIESIEATVPNHMARIVVVDHESTDADTLRYLETIRRRHCVVPFAGTFNFSKIINHGVATACQEGCFSHYLLLNNDVEALEPGWLERMVGLASRKEVGVVGALLVYPDRVVQHAGVVVGLHYAADNRGKGWRAFDAEGRRLLGPERRLISVQDQAAVTGACMLLRAAVYEQLGGMDERFAVGFGDVDLCLRARALGYKVLLDAHSILVHHESATRGQAMGDPHPCDTLKFRLRYAREIQTWDAFTNPNQSRLHGNAPSSSARSRWNAAMHTVEVTLPSIVVDEQALPSSRRRAA